MVAIDLTIQGSTAISSMSDISSTTETTKDTSDEIATVLDVVDMERFFVIGVLDELRVAFSCSYQVSFCMHQFNFHL